MTVRELLDQSHTAHNNYRNAVRERRTSDANDWLMTAATRRKEAHAADPQHTDLAWDDEALKYPHVALTEFYEKTLHG